MALTVIEPKQPEPYPPIVELLQALLLEAQSGELRALGVACVYRGRVVWTAHHTDDGELHDLITQAHLLAYDLMVAEREE